MTVDLIHNNYKREDFNHFFVDENGNLQKASSSPKSFLPIPGFAKKAVNRVGNYLLQWGTSPHAVSKSVDETAKKALQTFNSAPMTRKEVSIQLKEIRQLKANLTEYDQFLDEYNKESYLGKDSFASCPKHERVITDLQKRAQELSRDLREMDRNNFKAIRMHLDHNPSKLLHETYLVQLIKKYDDLLDQGKLTFEEAEDLETLFSKIAKLLSIFEKVEAFTQRVKDQIEKEFQKLDPDQERDISLIYLVHLLKGRTFEQILEDDHFLKSMPDKITELENDLKIHFKLKNSKFKDFDLDRLKKELKGTNAGLAKELDELCKKANTVDKEELYRMIHAIFVNRPKNLAAKEALIERILTLSELTRKSVEEILKKPDFLPTEVQLHHIELDDHLFDACIDKIYAFNDLYDWVLKPKNQTPENWSNFKEKIMALTPSLRETIEIMYYQLCNRKLLNQARQEISGNLHDHPMLQSSQLLKVLRDLNFPVDYRTISGKDADQALERFLDPRWIGKVLPERMQEMIQECLETHILIQDHIFNAIKQERGNASFVQTLYQELNAKNFGQIGAIMLMNVPEKVSDKPYAMAELHRALSVMLAHCKDLTLNMINAKRERLKQEPKEMWIIPKDLKLTQLEPFAWVKGMKTSERKGNRLWDDIRGINSQEGAAVAEENLTGDRDYPPGHSNAVHEFMHAIFRDGLNKGKTASGKDLSALKKEIEWLYQQKESKISDFAKKAGVYVGWQYSTGERHEDSYAASDIHEWVAMFAQSFFDCVAIEGTPIDHRYATKTKLPSLGKEERIMLDLFADLFGKDATVPYSNPRID